MEEVGSLGPVSLEGYRKKLVFDFVKKYFADNSKIISFFKKRIKIKNLFDEKKFIEEINLSSKILLSTFKSFFLCQKAM